MPSLPHSQVFLRYPDRAYEYKFPLSRLLPSKIHCLQGRSHGYRKYKCVPFSPSVRPLSPVLPVHITAFHSLLRPNTSAGSAHIRQGKKPQSRGSAPRSPVLPFLPRWFPSDPACLSARQDVLRQDMFFSYRSAVRTLLSPFRDRPAVPRSHPDPAFPCVQSFSGAECREVLLLHRGMCSLFLYIH